MTATPTIRRATPSVSDNPYEAPTANSAMQVATTNPVGRVGFIVSLAGFTGVAVVGPLGPTVSAVGMCLAFLCLPGLVVSIFGVFRTPKRLAKWGIGLGLLGSLYLPTFYLSMFVFPYR